MKIKFNPDIKHINDDTRYKVEIEKLFEIGAQFGHMSSKRNHKMSSYVLESIHGKDLIDMRQTHLLLNKALNFIYEIAKKDGDILLYAPKSETAQYVEQIGEITGMHYVTSRWLGGLMTNFFTVNRSLETLKKTEMALEQNAENQNNEKKAAIEEQVSYGTKKELLMLQRKQNKLKKTLGGIREMKNLPNVLIITDSKAGRTAIAEAKTLKIPVISLLDTNSDPTNVTCPIPMNDDAERVIRYFLYFVSQAVLAGKADYTANQKSHNNQKEEDIISN